MRCNIYEGNFYGMLTPQISVIITTYNVERYIARTVESVFSQSVSSLEIVIVDDCSSDATWQKIEALHALDSRIVPIRMERNSGPGAARNRALAAARGEWIAVLDGDDVFLPGRLERLLTIASESGADIVVDNQEVRPEDDQPVKPMFRAIELSKLQRLTTDFFITSNSTFGSGHNYGYFKPLIRAAYLRTTGIRYPEEIRIGEDYVFMLELLLSGAQCVVSAETGYGYTVRTGSISHRLKESDIFDMIRQDERLLSIYSLSAQAARQQARRSRKLMEQLYYTRMLNAAKSYDFLTFAKAAFACPSALLNWREPIVVRLQRLVKG